MRMSDSETDRWELELHHIATGQRDRHIGQLGNASSYIEGLIRSRPSPSASRQHFLAGLRRFSQNWNPTALTSPLAALQILDIFERYTPLEGLPKVFRLFRLGHYLDSSIDELPGADLRAKALDVLDAYFPADVELEQPLDTSVPSTKPNGLASYKHILREHFRLRKYQTLATERLLAIGELDEEELQMQQWHSSNPRARITALSHVIRELVKANDIERIARTYEYCLARDLGDDFRKAAGKAGLSWNYDNREVELETTGGSTRRKIRLTLTPVALAKHLGATWDAIVRSSRVRVRKLARAKDQDKN
jgi:hypothetical protein